MKNDTIFLYLIASVSFLFALYNALAFWAKRNMTGKTTGTINSITSPNPETAKTRNSKSRGLGDVYKRQIGWMGKSMFQEIAYKSP